MRKLLMFSLIGFFAQLVDGSLGMAYGVTASSLLLAGGSAAAVASASVHLAEVGTTLASGISHWRYGNIHWPTVCWLAIPGGAGAFLGASVLTSVDGPAVRPWIAGLLLLLGVYVLIRFAFGLIRRPLDNAKASPRFLVPLGSLGGFVDAIGGGGWGPITTPALLTAGRMAPRKAIGSVSASEFIVSSAASIGFLTQLGREAIDPRIVAGLLIGGVAVAPFAAWLVRRLDTAVLGTLVGVLLIMTNTRSLLILGEVEGSLRATILLLVVSAGLGLIARVARRTTRRNNDGVAATPADELVAIA
jgi:uncharacterized protein